MKHVLVALAFFVFCTEVHAEYKETMDPSGPTKNLQQDFGLKDDGAKSNQSDLIQKAINEFSAAGGGRLIMPKGTSPNIDRLAAEGMKFNNYYGGVYCAPARWTLLTGMHDGRIGGWGNNRSGLPIQRDSGKITEAEHQKRLADHKAKSHPITGDEVFLAQIAQQAGYKTAQFGKLDRGFLTWHERVKRFAWDFYEGYYDHNRCHGFYPPYLWRNGERFELPGNTLADCGKTSEQGNEPVGYGGETYSQNVFIEGLLNYLRSHQDEPFFLYHRISYLPTLLGQPQTQLHDFVVVNNNNKTMGNSALITREGYKLVEADRNKGLFQLYNILEDNEERIDLASQYPEKVERLKQILKR